MGILLEKLTEYSESDFYPYHMPGHKRNMAGELFREWITRDITEIEGFDNLHQAKGILKQVQEEAAKAYGARESFYLVNGSTCGILSAISATVPFGGELLIARNCHKSVYHGAYLRHLTLRYLYPETAGSFEVCEAVTPLQVKLALEKYPQVSAVLIVSPTYEGRIADVEAIARLVHEKGLPLIVDEAHGAHLGFGEAFALNSARLGADLVINSLHKTLPAMTQTALLHYNEGRVDLEVLKRYLRIYQTSSPSYVLMAGMEEAVRMAVEGREAFAVFEKRWTELLMRLQNCRKIRILPESFEECEKKKQDIGKLVLSVKGTGLSGQEFYDILLEKYHLQPEMACESYVLAMFTVGDTQEGYRRLAEAVLEIDAGLGAQERIGACGQKASAGTPEGAANKGSADDIVAKAVALHACEEIPLYEAWDARKEAVPLSQAKGRVAGEFLNLYPPGIPMAVPGERLSAEVVQRLQCCLEAGLSVQGISGEGTLSVLWEG